MNFAKIVPLEHQVHPVPQHAKPATKESLMVKVVVLAAIVYSKPFKIKVPEHRARIAQRDGNSPTKVPLPVSVWIGKHPAVAQTRNI
jgi:hypothetical protein